MSLGVIPNTMDTKYFKILLPLLLAAILVFGYLTTGVTYHKSAGFGSAEINVRLGSFSYNYLSDQIGYSDHAIGVTNLLGSKINFTPLSFLSSDASFSRITDSQFLQIKCGERDYLVPTKQKNKFLEWISGEIANSNPPSPVPTPYFVEKGDTQKQLDNCSL